MHRLSVELIPDSELGRFTARIPVIPAYGEGESEEEAIDDLKDALQGYIEAFGLVDASHHPLLQARYPGRIELAMQAPKPAVDVVAQARDRYAELVDKKFRSPLSPAEQEELKSLDAFLDESEAELYEPIERKLESVLAKLRQRSPER